MDTHGAVPLDPVDRIGEWMAKGMTYEEVQREFSIEVFTDFWQKSGEAMGLPPDDSGDVRLMAQLLVDGTPEDVVIALMPREAK
jgi:hypothetical protein